MKQLPVKVITHAGRCHADEVGAVAILLGIDADIPVIRIPQVGPEDILHPHVAVVDIGRHHDSFLNNYDHHHDRNLPASCSLVWDDFGFQLLANRFPELGYDKIVLIQAQMHTVFWNHISDVDTGKVKTAYGVPGIPGIIAQMYCLPGLNSDEIFAHAVTFMSIAMNACISSLYNDIKTREVYDALPLYESGRVAVNDSSTEIPSWKEWAKKEDGPWFMIHPSNRGAGYLLVSQDSERFPIDPDVAPLVPVDFVHNARFISQHPTMDDALTMAAALVDHYWI